MAVEGIEKLDELFDGLTEIEEIDIADATEMLGTTIRKAAHDVMDRDEVTARMQRAYLLTEAIHNTMASDDETDKVTVSKALAEGIRHDAQGDSAQVIPISDAMRLVKSRLEEPKEEPIKTEKSDGPVAWGADLADVDDSEAVSWGDDPPGVRS